MTMSSHPWIKLLVAIIAAIVFGIIFNSWGWGIATFFIVMFIFVWVASWIFGGSVKGKVEVSDELEELLNKLESVGNIKNELPLSARGWCNSLGLYVQLREKGGMSRLEAGDDKYRSRIDAWRDYSFEWKVKKYDRGDWEKLVDPTYDIANWLSRYAGLPEEHMSSFNKAIEVFKKEGYLKLPDIKKGGEKPLKLEESESKADDEVRVKTPPNIVQPRTRIEEYDQELLEDIERLKRHIRKQEDTQKEFMRSYGASEKTVSEVAQKARMEDRPISFDGSSRNVLRIQTFLTEMAPIYKAFPFRAWTRLQLFIPAETNVITKDDWLRFDTRILDDEERRDYAKQWEATRVLNYSPNQIPVYKWYPTPELMRFVEDMLNKYGATSVLTKDEYSDENMKSAWEEALGKEQA